ncbi:hypothetical protein SELMODRAFT_406311 [Selaginella moellendorffii]|uniref:CCHC-type domain-containing protein n=1 Tax=Selaginella moellendorffii TaxID=88036 RepID=D8R1Y8_SELML|nr:hypothetical protein SELMODRAFT_406311 [Selaginella moellendorffii]
MEHHEHRDKQSKNKLGLTKSELGEEPKPEFCLVGSIFGRKDKEAVIDEAEDEGEDSKKRSDDTDRSQKKLDFDQYFHALGNQQVVQPVLVSMAGTSNPVIMKKALPPTFHGMENEDYEWHLKQFNAACALNNEIMDVEKIALFPFTLKGDAAEWFYDRNATYATFAALSDDFKGYYKKKYECRDPVVRLQEIYQGDMELAEDYAGRFNKIYGRCDATTVLDVLAMNWFLNGLRSEMQTPVRLEAPTTLDTARAAAEKVDKILHKTSNALRRELRTKGGVDRPEPAAAQVEPSDYWPQQGQQQQPFPKDYPRMTNHPRQRQWFKRQQQQQFEQHPRQPQQQQNQDHQQLRLPAPPQPKLLPGPGSTAHITCYQCGQKGHYATTCPNEQQNKGKAPQPAARAVEVQSDIESKDGIEVEAYAVMHARKRQAMDEDRDWEKEKATEKAVQRLSPKKSDMLITIKDEPMTSGSQLEESRQQGDPPNEELGERLVELIMERPVMLTVGELITGAPYLPVQHTRLPKSSTPCDIEDYDWQSGLSDEDEDALLKCNPDLVRIAEVDLYQRTVDSTDAMKNLGLIEKFVKPSAKNVREESVEKLIEQRDETLVMHMNEELEEIDLTDPSEEPKKLKIAKVLPRGFKEHAY